MQTDRLEAMALLRAGEPPDNRELLEKLTVGVDFVTDFWKEKYLEEYIREGGSKIKFVTGRRGSGKTHFLQVMTLRAQDSGYLTVNCSAKTTWLNDFKEIYARILSGIDFQDLLRRCGDKIAEGLGFRREELPQGVSFVDYLSGAGLLDAITKREIRTQLNTLFLQNPWIDNNFGIACSLLAGSVLGYPPLEEHNKEQLMLWLQGDKTVPLPVLRRLGLFPCRITKYNARHMLRSLLEVVTLAGYTGLVVTVDDLEMLMNKNSVEEIRYTKLKREDAYESIRELIDEIDSLKHVLFLFAFDSKLAENETEGLKSYQALWMRIQNEVTSGRLNRFTDILDLDALAKQCYTPQMAAEMSRRLAEVLNLLDNRILPIDNPLAQELTEHARFASVSLPLQVNLATIGGVARD